MVDYGWIGKLLELGRVDDGLDTWNAYIITTPPPTHTQPFNGLLSGTTRVGRYQKKHSPTHTHPDHRTSFIIFLHLQ